MIKFGVFKPDVVVQEGQQCVYLLSDAPFTIKSGRNGKLLL